jgi:hypothetical protein
MTVELPDDLPDDLPDEPRWVEANGIAASSDGWRRAVGPTGVALGHDATRLIALANITAEAGVDALLAPIVADRPDHALLFPLELAPAVARLGRRPLRAIIHTMADPSTLADGDGATMLLDDSPLDHVPPALATELALARRLGRVVWTVYVDDAPVTFAYASWRSRRWFDVSVDTLASARQLGLARIAATALIRAERADGREPVWGADEDNRASRALAHRLGFAAVDELGVAAAAR